MKIDEPSGTTVTFAYDANGQRVKKTTQTGGSNPTMTVVNDTYQNGRLAYQTNLGGTVLATFTYDPSGVPESVVVGADPTTSPRYDYGYNGHGDVVALTDASGNMVASYTYDVWGNLTNSSENIPNADGWTNPYRYDGRDGARYDTETGLYWLSTRAYDSTLGRFLQRDPLGRAPLFFWSQPYVYGGNNPLINVDPSGQRFADEDILSQATAQQQIAATRRTSSRASCARRPRAPATATRRCAATTQPASAGA